MPKRFSVLKQFYFVHNEWYLTFPISLVLSMLLFIQPQPPANEANAVFDQWRASSFGAATADKKDQTPSVSIAPVNDQFADFMKLQSSSSSPVEASPASQQAAMPAATQQRSDVPQQPNMFSMQPQVPNTFPGQSQAFYMQPEEHGDFPENP